MSRLSRGQVVGLVAIALIFATATFIFDKITDYQANKINYLVYDKNKPSTLLNGDYLEYVNLNEEYVEKGLKTNKEYQITYSLNNTETTKIDTTKFGTYQVKYYLSNKQTLTRTVVIADTKSPSISVPDKQTIESSQAVSFDLKEGVVVTDNSGEVQLTFNNTLSTIPGDYVITYEAKDSSNNITKRKRLIKVVSGIEFTYQDQTLTITYPLSKNKNYTYKYSLDNGNTFIDAQRKTKIKVSEGSIIASVYENGKYIMAGSFNITN